MLILKPAWISDKWTCKEKEVHFRIDEIQYFDSKYPSSPGEKYVNYMKNDNKNKQFEGEPDEINMCYR